MRPDLSCCMDVRSIFLISRPLAWIVPFLVYLVGWSYAGFSEFWLGLYQLFCFTFPFGIAGYGLNDYYDRESDKRSWRKNYVDLDWDSVWVWSVLGGAVFWSSSVFFLFAGNMVNFLLGSLLVFAGFAYSHPLFRYKEVVVLGWVCNVLVYALLPGAMAIYTGSSIGVDLGIQILGLVFFAFALNILVDVADIASDARAGFKTVPVRVGSKRSIALASGLGFVGVLITWPETMFYRISMILGGFTMVLPLFFHDVKRASWYSGLFILTLSCASMIHYLIIRLF